MGTKRALHVRLTITDVSFHRAGLCVICLGNTT